MTDVSIEIPPDQDDDDTDDDVRDTWKNHEQTIKLARMTRQSARNALEALVNVSNTSTDPNVRALGMAYQVTKDFAKRFDGVEGRKAKLP